MIDVLGETIGSYRIIDKLSEGGMGVVFRAEHVLLGHAVAIKLILPIWSENHDVVRRFFAEAKVTSAIRHPGIVEIFDFGYLADGRAYLVMELLRGEPLARRLAREPVQSQAMTAWLGCGIASALAAAHERGVVHRDLKPDNVFLVPSTGAAMHERIKLLDFGIAKLGELHGSGGATQTGVIMGTPAYMSPEQSRGAGRVDTRADLYSLGCILYEALAGRPPFVAEGHGELIAAHLLLPPDPLHVHAHVDPRLESIVMRMLEKEPDRRPAAALEVISELTAIFERANAHGSSTPHAPTVIAPLSAAPVRPDIVTPTTTLRAAALAIEASTTRPAHRRARALGAAAAVVLAAIAFFTRGGDSQIPASAPPREHVTSAPIDGGADAPVEVIASSPPVGSPVDPPRVASPPASPASRRERPAAIRKRISEKAPSTSSTSLMVEDLRAPKDLLVDDLVPPTNP